MCLHIQVRQASQIPPNSICIKACKYLGARYHCLISCSVLRTLVLPWGVALDLVHWVRKTDNLFRKTQDTWAPGGQCILPTVKTQKKTNLQTKECLQWNSFSKTPFLRVGVCVCVCFRLGCWGFFFSPGKTWFISWSSILGEKPSEFTRRCFHG